MVKMRKLSKKEKREQIRGALIIIAALIGMIVLFLGTYVFFKSLMKVEYEGMTFTKEKFGEVNLYHYYYYFLSGGNLSRYDLYLRNNPAKNEVPVEDEINVLDEKIVYISINDSGLNECKFGQIAVASLSIFFTGNGFKVLSASPDYATSQEKGIDYANCENRFGDAVVIIKKADSSRIYKYDSTHLDSNCYVIEIANCDEFLPTIEKFQIRALADARARAEN